MSLQRNPKNTKTGSNSRNKGQKAVKQKTKNKMAKVKSSCQ